MKFWVVFLALVLAYAEAQGPDGNGFRDKPKNKKFMNALAKILSSDQLKG